MGRVLSLRRHRLPRGAASIEAAAVAAVAGAALAATRLWMRRHQPRPDRGHRARSALRRTFPFGSGDPVTNLIDDGRDGPPPDRGRLFDIDGEPADDAIRSAADPASDGTSGPAAENAIGPATGGTPGPGASRVSG